MKGPFSEVICIIEMSISVHIMYLFAWFEFIFKAKKKKKIPDFIRVQHKTWEAFHSSALNSGVEKWEEKQL